MSPGGIPELAILSAELTEIGISGDGWRYPFHGGRRKAILLITIEGIDELVSQGIELTQMRTPCATLEVYGSGIQAAMYDARVQAGDPESQRWGVSGFYASVVQPGTIRAGDTIALLD